MKFKFPPLSFNSHPAVSKFFPYNIGKKNYILVFHFYEGIENFPNFIALFDINGKLIRKRNIEKDIDLYFSMFLSRDDNYKVVFLVQKDGMIMKIDSMLNLKYVTRFENTSRKNLIQKIDIDCDGENEFVIKGKNKGDLLIYRNDFSNPVTLMCGEDVAVEQISVIKKKESLPKIFVFGDSNLYKFKYETTFLYQYKNYLFIPVFLSVLLIHLIVKHIKKYHQLKIGNIQKQISELQIKSVQNQLDPHFTLNIFATFGNLINEKDTERANYIFNRYASLLKAIVLNSENIQISLQEELDFVSSYLELEKFRYDNKFTFQIKMQESVDKQKHVPKMILHIFVENAIKHGLRHLDSGGLLVIEGMQNNGVVNISIVDNGIGRLKAKELASFSTGKGIHIIDKIIKCYSKLYNQKISYKIDDLYENNIASGTGVNIRIPINQ